MVHGSVESMRVVVLPGLSLPRALELGIEFTPTAASNNGMCHYYH